ncbi:MAG: helix-turn-helix domain-containing protein [Solirubrobacteraceae bacterium]
MTATQTTSGVGELLRAWRQRRNLSQLELSLESAISTRHLSFVETGRAKPSREMVLHLAQRLELPLRERDGLLLAAGFAPVYGERGLEDAAMSPIREALDRFLRAHEPYPAVVVDRHWNMVCANEALAMLLGDVAPELLSAPANVLRIALHPDGMAPRIANLAEWSGHLLQRLRRSVAITADVELSRLYDELAGYPGVDPGDALHDGAAGADIVLPLRLRRGELELTFLSTISTFGTASDVTLDELSIEAFYPADDRTASALLDGAG